MKIKYHATEHYLILTITNTCKKIGVLSLSWRQHGMDKRRQVSYGALTTKKPKEIKLLRSELGVTHQIIFTAQGLTYTRYIPAKYLNLTSEHD